MWPSITPLPEASPKPDRLPPEDLAALRAKVAQAARQYGKAATRTPR